MGRSRSRPAILTVMGFSTWSSPMLAAMTAVARLREPRRCFSATAKAHFSRARKSRSAWVRLQSRWVIWPDARFWISQWLTAETTKLHPVGQWRRHLQDACYLCCGNRTFVRSCCRLQWRLQSRRRGRELQGRYRQCTLRQRQWNLADGSRLSRRRRSGITGRSPSCAIRPPLTS